MDFETYPSVEAIKISNAIMTCKTLKTSTHCLLMGNWQGLNCHIKGGWPGQNKLSDCFGRVGYQLILAIKNPPLYS